MARTAGSLNKAQNKIPDHLTLYKRIRKKEVQEMMGWSKATLERKVKSGDFLQPVVEAGIPYWFLPQVLEYIANQFNLTSEQAREMADPHSEMSMAHN